MIAPAMPALSGNGLAMRLGVFLEAMALAGETELLVVPIAGRADAPAELPDRLGVRHRVLQIAGRQDTQLSLVMRLADPAARLRAFQAYGRPSLAGAVSMPVRAEISSLIAAGAFDVVHVARLYLSDAASLPAAKPVRTLDIDDDDADAWRARGMVLQRDGNSAAASWALAEAEAFAALARRNLRTYDRIFAAAPASIAANAEIVPNSVAFPKRLRRTDYGDSLVFVGSLGYEPNADGILWFLEQAWPSLRRSAPELRLDIVGADPPPALRALDGKQGISVHGAMADLSEIYERAMLAIAPLRSGGGTRIKLIEAAAWRVPFVATSAAAKGLAFGSSSCGWIADDAAEFSRAVLAARADRNERVRRAEGAYRTAKRLHDRDHVVARLSATFAALTQESRCGEIER